MYAPSLHMLLIILCVKLQHVDDYYDWVYLLHDTEFKRALLPHPINNQSQDYFVTVRNGEGGSGLATHLYLFYKFLYTD